MGYAWLLDLRTMLVYTGLKMSMSSEVCQAAAAANGEGQHMEVRAEGLSCRFAGRRVFTGAEFVVGARECLVVAGPNGSGKSSLLRVAAGLVRPASGRILIDAGAESVCLDSGSGRCPTLSRLVGLASPDVHLYGELTVAENLMLFARLRGLSYGQDALEANLIRVGLQDRRRDRLSTLSTGMQQRARLLFALQHAPPVLLLDEPGSNLDAAGRDLVADIIEKQLRHGIVFIATNDPVEVRFGHQILALGSI
jgi:heme exporter protein A